MEEGSDPPTKIYVFGCVNYLSPPVFDDVAPEDFRTIANIPWFLRQALLADAKSDFKEIDWYSWDGDLY